MADSTINDLSKLKVLELRKELKMRGLSHAGDKAELVARLQAALSQDDHGDITLDSDEIDSDGVLDDEDDKMQPDILDDCAADTLNDELALADNPQIDEDSVEKTTRSLKRKMTNASEEKSKDIKNYDGKEGCKKIVLNRAHSVISSKTCPETVVETIPKNIDLPQNKVKITIDGNANDKLEMRAKRFGLPVKLSEEERKEARRQRFGGNATVSSGMKLSPNVTENFEKLKRRAERFGQSVSKIMSDIENKEKLEKRKAKFGIVK